MKLEEVRLYKSVRVNGKEYDHFHIKKTEHQDIELSFDNGLIWIKSKEKKYAVSLANMVYFVPAETAEEIHPSVKKVKGV